MVRTREMILYNHYATGSTLVRLGLDSMRGQEFHYSVMENAITVTRRERAGGEGED